MSWETLPIRGGLGAYRDQWDALNLSLYAGHPLFDSRFVDALLEHVASGDEHLCVHRSSGRIDGLLIARRYKPGQWGLFLPAQAQIGALLMPDATPLSSLVSQLPGLSWSIDLFSQDVLYSPLTREGASLPLRFQDHATTMNISLEGTFEDYWQSRSRNLAKNVRRHRNRLSHDGLVSQLEVIRESKDMKRAVTHYGALESSGWKGREGTAISIDNPQGAFYVDLMQRFAETGQASVYEYRLGDRLAASRLLIQSKKMIVVLKTTYDETLSDYAPGRLHLYEMLEREFAEKRANVMEFYTNATREQLSWSTSFRPIRHVTLFRGSIALEAHSALRRFRFLLGSLRRLDKDSAVPGSAADVEAKS